MLTNFDAQDDLKQAARELAQGPVAARSAEVDRTEAYPWDNVADLVEAGFMGMTIPAEYGGQGRSYLEATLVIEEIAKACGVTGRIVVEANMGAIGAIMKYGTHAQKTLAAGLVLGGDKPGHPHYRAGCGQRRQRNEHPGGAGRQLICHQWKKALDNRWRRVPVTSDLCPSIRTRGRSRHRGIYCDT